MFSGSVETLKRKAVKDRLIHISPIFLFFHVRIVKPPNKHHLSGMGSHRWAGSLTVWGSLMLEIPEKMFQQCEKSMGFDALAGWQSPWL